MASRNKPAAKPSARAEAQAEIAADDVIAALISTPGPLQAAKSLRISIVDLATHLDRPEVQAGLRAARIVAAEQAQAQGAAAMGEMVSRMKALTTSSDPRESVALGAVRDLLGFAERTMVRDLKTAATQQAKGAVWDIPEFPVELVGPAEETKDPSGEA